MSNARAIARSISTRPLDFVEACADVLSDIEANAKVGEVKQALDLGATMAAYRFLLSGEGSDWREYTDAHGTVVEFRPGAGGLAARVTRGDGDQFQSPCASVLWLEAVIPFG